MTRLTPILAISSLLIANAEGQSVPSVGPLVHEGLIEAPLETVWQAWTTSEGLRSWLAPHAEIDLRIGGRMRANYAADGSLDDAGTIENTILAYEPYRMLSIRVSKAPANFPFANVIGDMWTVVYFDSPQPGRTHVRVVGLGFTAEPESQAMRAFFDDGNATTIRQLQDRLGSGKQ